MTHPHPELLTDAELAAGAKAIALAHNLPNVAYHETSRQVDPAAGTVTITFAVWPRRQA